MKQADPLVAVLAEQPADTAGFVAMIDVEAVDPYAVGRGRCADGAFTSLSLQHLVVVALCHSVPTLQFVLGKPCR